MTLVLKNLQKVVALNMHRIEKDITLLRRIMKIDTFDVSVLFVTNNYMQNLNEKYRLVAGPTDVLSFPALEIAQPGVLPSVEEEEAEDELSLGDVFLAPAYIQHQCQVHNDNFEYVMMTTITHGLCHLIGLDHETEKDQLQMVSTERTILETFNKLTGYGCKPLTCVGH